MNKQNPLLAQIANQAAEDLRSLSVSHQIEDPAQTKLPNLN